MMKTDDSPRLEIPKHAIHPEKLRELMLRTLYVSAPRVDISLESAPASGRTFTHTPQSTVLENSLVIRLGHIEATCSHIKFVDPDSSRERVDLVVEALFHNHFGLPKLYKKSFIIDHPVELEIFLFGSLLAFSERTWMTAAPSITYDVGRPVSEIVPVEIRLAYLGYLHACPL